MNHDQIVQRINDLSDLIQQVSTNNQFNITLTWTILGIVIAALGGVTYFFITTVVNKKVNNEIDKRLIELLNSNPPVFIASGTTVPDKDKKIYLSQSIPGIDQFDPDKAISIDIIASSTIGGKSSRLYTNMRVNENGIVEIEIPNYSSINGKVYWNIIWPRRIYTN